MRICEQNTIDCHYNAFFLAGEQDAIKVTLVLGITWEYSAAEVCGDPPYKSASAVQLALKGRGFEDWRKPQKFHKECGIEKNKKQKTRNKREP